MTVDVEGLLQPPPDKPDTPEQAQMRACLVGALSGHEDTTTVQIAFDLIAVMRDQLLAGAALVRRQAALAARGTMTAKELALASGQSPQTIARLLTEARSD